MVPQKFSVPLLILLVWTVSLADAGSPCPSGDKLFPCFCTNFADGNTLLVCPNIESTSHLETVTKPLKSMILDRVMLLNVFVGDKSPDISDNLIETNASKLKDGMFPKIWLSELRIRELEIQNGNLHGCFLCNDALEGQADFLTSLVVRHANLSGHVCSTCGLGSNPSSISTRELRRTPHVGLVDFSYNNIEFVDGNAFPSSMINLTRIVLSNNKISKIYDQAFSNLHKLTELDLSRNQLTNLSRKVFRDRDTVLKSIDLSYNSIVALPRDVFSQLTGLREIKMSHNLLQVMDSSTWTRTSSFLERIDLRGNFLVCNCSMNWVSTQLRNTKIIGHCISPDEVAFQELKPTLVSLRACK